MQADGQLGLDRAGDVYLSGSFLEPLDFDPGPGIDRRTPNARSLYLTRLQADGSYGWTRTFDWPAGFELKAMAVSPEGRACVGVTITAPPGITAMDLDPGPGVVEVPLVLAEHRQVIVCLDADGLYRSSAVSGTAGHGEGGSPPVMDFDDHEQLWAAGSPGFWAAGSQLQKFAVDGPPVVETAMGPFQVLSAAARGPESRDIGLTSWSTLDACLETAAGSGLDRICVNPPPTGVVVQEQFIASRFDAWGHYLWSWPLPLPFQGVGAATASNGATWFVAYPGLIAEDPSQWVYRPPWSPRTEVRAADLLVGKIDLDGHPVFAQAFDFFAEEDLRGAWATTLVGRDDGLLLFLSNRMAAASFAHRWDPLLDGPVVGGGDYHVSITRLSARGEYEWTERVAGGLAEVRNLATNERGRVALFGRFFGEADLGVEGRPLLVHAPGNGPDTRDYGSWLMVFDEPTTTEPVTRRDPPPVTEPTCFTSCAQAQRTCGLMSDRCGGTLQCGTCTWPQECGGRGEPNVCATPVVPVLAGGLINPGRVQALPDDVFVAVNGDDPDPDAGTYHAGRLLKVPRDGGAAQTLLQGSGPVLGVAALEVPARVYVSTSTPFVSSDAGPGSILGVDHSGAHASLLVGGLGQPEDLLVGYGYLYWVDRGLGAHDGSLGRVSLTTGAVEVLQAGLDRPTGLARENAPAGLLVFATPGTGAADGTVWAAESKVGGTLTALATGLRSPHAVSLWRQGATVYWLDDGTAAAPGPRVAWADARASDGGVAQGTLAPAGSSRGGLVAFHDDVYVADPGAPDGGGVFRVSVHGTRRRQLAEGLPGVTALDFDGRFLFCSDRGVPDAGAATGRVVRVDR